MSIGPETLRRNRQVMDRLSRGDTVADVAARFRVTASRIYQIKADAALRAGGLPKVARDKSRNETILGLSDSGRSHREIGHQVGLTEGRISQIVAAAKRDLPITERNRRIIEASEKGEDPASIGQRFGIHRTSVGRIIHKGQNRPNAGRRADAPGKTETGMNGEQPSLLIPPDLAPVLAAAVEIAISVVALDDTVNLRARADDLAALHRLLTAAAD